MALINIPRDHTKLRKTLSIEKRPLTLKDYLSFRDDLSSCSSSGFNSFPRRQCCTTISFLLESDLKNKSKGNHSSTIKRLLRSRLKPGSNAISTLQRASVAVLNAVKLLPFPSIKSSSSPSLKSNSLTKVLLPRSFSRKLFKRSFGRKADEEDHAAAASTTDISSTTTRSNSWSESEFTTDVLQSTSGNSKRSSENGVDDGKANLPEKKKDSNIGGVTVDEDSLNLTKNNDGPNEQGKEQFSPVSVLDCLFDDEEDNCYPFEDHLARLEVTKQKLMKKIGRFESLAQLEPMDLEKRIALAELEDGSVESPKELYSVSVNNKDNMSDVGKQEKDREANEKLLKLLKAKIPFEPHNPFLDLFRERSLSMVEETERREN